MACRSDSQGQVLDDSELIYVECRLIWGPNGFSLSWNSPHQYLTGNGDGLVSFCCPQVVPETAFRFFSLSEALSTIV